jgi:hypothetical protein
MSATEHESIQSVNQTNDSRNVSDSDDQVQQNVSFNIQYWQHTTTHHNVLLVVKTNSFRWKQQVHGLGIHNKYNSKQYNSKHWAVWSSKQH